MKKLYHGSKIPNLKVIKPNKSTHGEEWVYATESKTVALLFMNNYYGDLSCQICSLNGQLSIIERFQGALNIRYKNKQGYLYEIDGTDFVSGKTNFKRELISDKEAKVLNCIEMNDNLEAIIEEEKLGNIKIYHYPDRPSDIPLNNEDLIAKVKPWVDTIGIFVLNSFNELYPDLCKRLCEEMNIEYKKKW